MTKALKSTDKTKLSEFTVEEARGWVIDEFQQIENRINKKIIDHVNPSNKIFFESIILNSSVIDIGGKMKILTNIGTEKKSTIEDIRKLASIRNGFAHAPFQDIIHIKAGEKNKDGVIPLSLETETNIEVMNAAGKLKVNNAYSYLVEFFHLNEKIRKEI